MSLSRRRLHALPCLLGGAAAAALLLVPGLDLPGHRGARRVTEGFRPGRWDARFRVARGPAALTLPEEPLRATVFLSGPATVRVRSADRESQHALGDAPAPVEVVLPRGGRAELEADATVRLHEIRLRRLGHPPWDRLTLVLAAALAGAALGSWRGGSWPIGSCLAVLAIAAAALRGRLGGLALAVGLERIAPAVALLAIGSALLLVRVFPRSADTPVAPRARLPLLFGGLTLVSCLAQVIVLPQPLVIGDPAAYHDMGGRFAAALGQVRGIDSLADALQALRPYAGLWATGLLYGAARALHDHLTTIYVLHSLAMAGAVAFLVRSAVRLAGEGLGALTGALAVLYPTFAVICGIVQPEPVILLLWTWSLDRLLSARGRRDPRALASAGMTFALGLALHPQGMWFLLAALLLAVAPFASVLLHPPHPRLVGAFALGLLPVAIATAAGEVYARPAVHVLDERYGFFSYTARYPLGFWLFIDSDGWQGPLRLEQTRYVAGFRAEEEAGRMQSRWDRLAYTARFLGENAQASLRTVLRNLHRLFHIPDNPFRRDWVLPYPLQVVWHRALIALFILGVPLALARGGGALLVPFVILAMTYPLYHVFNKYAVPATPFVLLGAALTLRQVLAERKAALVLALAAAALGSALRPADLALRGMPPEAARALLVLLHGGGLAAAFLIGGRRWAHDKAGRFALAAAAAVLLVPALAAGAGDPAWRQFSLPLDRQPRHEIIFGEQDLAELDAAPQAYLLLDLHIPEGDPTDLRLDFDGGLSVAGRELEATMPTFGLATVRGGRDPLGFRQWWRTPWRGGMARGSRVAITVRGPEQVRLFGDIGTPDADNVHEGLSLGEWPHLSVYRLMHDGEYRLAVRRPLAGRRRESRVGSGVVPGILGIRIAILDAHAGVGASAPPWRPVRVW